jgi:hypothetical protein
VVDKWWISGEKNSMLLKTPSFKLSKRKNRKLFEKIRAWKYRSIET